MLNSRIKRIAAIAAAITVVAVAAAYFAIPRWLQTGAGDPPLNYVQVSDRLATSGQPSAAQFDDLAAQGVGMVINLAPPGSYGSIADEGRLVAGRGMAYVNIPVDWERPQERDFELFSAVLAGAGDRKAWVHCQMNMRASVFVFLHRVVRARVPVDEAIAGVHAVWVPNDTWRAFIETVLRRHDIRFDPDFLV